MRNKFTLMLAVVAMLGLSGCWESSDVTMHEAGKYMGAKDPLATSGASRAEGLEKRFQLVQVDR